MAPKSPVGDEARSGLLWQVRFTLSNGTRYPVRITAIKVYIDGHSTDIAHRRSLSPSVVKGRRFNVHAVEPSTADSLRRGQNVRIRLIGRISYINAIDKDSFHYFAKYGLVSSLQRTRLKEDMPGDPKVYFGRLEEADDYIEAEYGKRTNQKQDPYPE